MSIVYDADGNRVSETGGGVTTKYLVDTLNPAEPCARVLIDTFPSFHGYHADLCRTFAASTVTDVQHHAWESIKEALRLAEAGIRPGVPARQIWQMIRDCLEDSRIAKGSSFHHAGHGIGLEHQEFPWLIPGSDQLLEAGDVIAIEPGLYSELLQGGVRLEQDYLVTETGCDRLSECPLELA